jgi:hypothetical protein
MPPARFNACAPRPCSRSDPARPGPALRRAAVRVGDWCRKQGGDCDGCTVRRLSGARRAGPDQSRLASGGHSGDSGPALEPEPALDQRPPRAALRLRTRRRRRRLLAAGYARARLLDPTDDPLRLLTVQYALFTAAITTYAVLLADTLGEPALEAAAQRAGATAIGIAVAGASFLIWSNPREETVPAAPPGAAR